MDHPESAPFDRRPVTLKRIAEKLGLSVTTVARSLKDGHKISAETVQRVRDTADALGYVRNLDGLRLRTGRSYTIAAHVGRHDGDGDPFRLGLMAGLHQRLARTDYALRSLAVGATDRPLAPILAAIRSNPADGFVLDRLTRDDERVALLQDYDLPFVALGTSDGPPLPGLTIDEAAGARALARALLGADRRRILHLDDDDRYLDSAARRGAVREVLDASGLATVASTRLESLPHDDLPAALAIMLKDGGVDGIICGSDGHFAAVLSALRLAGLPREAVGLALRSTSRLPLLLSGPVTIASFPAERVGTILADLLLRRIEGEDPATLRRHERLDILTVG